MVSHRPPRRSATDGKAWRYGVTLAPLGYITMRRQQQCTDRTGPPQVATGAYPAKQLRSGMGRRPFSDCKASTGGRLPGGDKAADLRPTSTPDESKYAGHIYAYKVSTLIKKFRAMHFGVHSGNVGKPLLKTAHAHGSDMTSDAAH